MRSITYIAPIAVLAAAALSGACASSAPTTGTETKPTPPKDNGATTTRPTDPAVEDLMPGLATDWKVKAAGYLDGRSNIWLATPPPVGNVKCAMSCHTTFPHVLARSALGESNAVPKLRTAFDTRVSQSVAGTATPFYGSNGDAKTRESFGTEAVLNAVALGMDDVGSKSPIGAGTKSALDRMWAQQRADGAWDWLEYGLEPFETRNDWGAALAGVVAGSIPENTSAAQAAGTAKIVSYLQKRMTDTAKPLVFHDKVAILWASGSLPSLLTPEQKEAIAAALDAKQLADGGFSLGSWGKGSQAAAGAGTSDGYATALATLALCRGMPEPTKRDDVKKALKWIAAGQQADGSWAGRSVNNIPAMAKPFMTDAATAYTALAITACIPQK
jgi:hypothetical protein